MPGPWPTMFVVLTTIAVMLPWPALSAAAVSPGHLTFDPRMVWPARPTPPHRMLEQTATYLLTSMRRDETTRPADENESSRQLLFHTLGDLLAVRVIAERVAGPAWQPATTDTRQRFIRLLVARMIDDSRPVIQDIADRFADIRITDARIREDGRHALNNVVIRLTDGRTIPLTLQWALVRERDRQAMTTGLSRWQITDIVYRGESVFDPYRADNDDDLADRVARLDAERQPIADGVPMPWARLRLRLAADGRPDTVDLVRSTGYGNVDDYAMKIARDWQLVPTEGRDLSEGAITFRTIQFSSESDPSDAR